MRRNDPFLEEVSARPDDVGLRLIYADWLEEQGDPRGELIRVQEEMAALPVHSDRYAELKPRRNALRRQVRGKWEKWLKLMGYVPAHSPMFTRLPDRRVERWRLVEEFIDVWYAPLKAGDGASEEELAAAEQRLGFPLPAALREWYGLAGNRGDVWSMQDHLVRPSALRMDSRRDALVFYNENQSCACWGIREEHLRRADPPIFRFNLTGPVSPDTTTFAIQVLLYEAKWSNNLLAWGQFDAGAAVFSEARNKFTRCGLPGEYWVAGPIHVYEGKDVLIETNAEEWVWVTARTETAYARLSEEVRSELERTR